MECTYQLARLLYRIQVGGLNKCINEEGAEFRINLVEAGADTHLVCILQLHTPELALAALDIPDSLLQWHPCMCRTVSTARNELSETLNRHYQSKTD